MSFFCKLALNAISCSTASQNTYDRMCCRISSGNERILGSDRFASGNGVRGVLVGLPLPVGMVLGEEGGVMVCECFVILMSSD